jgi:hypothetical protein
MKYIRRFKLFEEISKKDLNFISTEYNDWFTIGFEFEIETSDQKGNKPDFSGWDEDVCQEVIQTAISELNLRKKSEKDFVKSLVYNLTDMCEFDEIDLKKYNDLFDDSKFSQSEWVEIICHLRNLCDSIIFSENLEYLTDKVYQYLPNFCEKWRDEISFIGDSTLTRGIEIKSKTYCTSVDKAIEMCSDFFSDLESQDYWKFTKKTGLHINIGCKEKVQWNPIKGVLLLNDWKESDETPFVFREMTWRMNNKFCGSIIPHLKTEITGDKRFLQNDSDLWQEILNSKIEKIVDEVGFKNLGFNTSKLDQNYLEFRYVGGEVQLQTLIDKLKYFLFIVYAMTHTDYKKTEYLKKLYKFVKS